jgi:hypothetical protein
MLTVVGSVALTFHAQQVFVTYISVTYVYKPVTVFTNACRMIEDDVYSSSFRGYVFYNKTASSPQAHDYRFRPYLLLATAPRTREWWCSGHRLITHDHSMLNFLLQFFLGNQHGRHQVLFSNTVPFRQVCCEAIPTCRMAQQGANFSATKKHFAYQSHASMTSKSAIGKRLTRQKRHKCDAMLGVQVAHKDRI